MPRPLFSDEDDLLYLDPEDIGPRSRPALSIARILAWADDHFARTGAWPTHRSGVVLAAPTENWRVVQDALRVGGRGLPGGETLAKLLSRCRGVPNRLDLPPLDIDTILVWADEHFARTGAWPQATSGPVAAAPGETWAGVAGALRYGSRGLPAGGSLARLLARHRGVRNNKGRPQLDVVQVWAWAKAYHERHGRWPTEGAGPVEEAPGETWCGINAALRTGGRGLPGPTTLSRLLTELRNAVAAAQ